MQRLQESHVQVQYKGLDVVKKQGPRVHCKQKQGQGDRGNKSGSWGQDYTKPCRMWWGSGKANKMAKPADFAQG